MDRDKPDCHIKDEVGVNTKCGLLSYKHKQLLCSQVSCSQNYPSICEPYMENITILNKGNQLKIVKN